MTLKKEAKTRARNAYKRTLDAVEALQEHLAKVGPLADMRERRTTNEWVRAITNNAKEMNAYSIVHEELP